MAESTKTILAEYPGLDKIWPTLPVGSEVYPDGDGSLAATLKIRSIPHRAEPGYVVLTNSHSITWMNRQFPGLDA